MNRSFIGARRAPISVLVLLFAVAALSACGSGSSTTASTAPDNTAQAGGEDTAQAGGEDTAQAGGEDTAQAGAEDTAAGDAAAEVGGVRVVSPEAGEAILTSSDPELVVLDVRTPAEYAEGHLPGATLVDFNAPDFHDQLATLDKNKDYVVYCRSGNRSGQAREMMADMGFSSVADIDGGIVAWEADGLPVTTE